MRRKTLLTSLLVILLALVPTYLIIYNTLHATGLPDFSSQKYAEIVEPNKHMLTLNATGDEYYLMAGVLSNLADEPVDNATVEKDARYTITFVSKNGNETECRIYAATDRLSAYVETAQGKLYELYMPEVSYNGNPLSPSVVRYGREKTDGTTVLSKEFSRISESGFDPFIQELSSFSELADVRLANEDLRFSATLRDGGGNEIATCGSMSELIGFGASADVRIVNLTVEWYLDKDVSLRTAYIFRIGQ